MTLYWSRSHNITKNCLKGILSRKKYFKWISRQSKYFVLVIGTYRFFALCLGRRNQTYCCFGRTAVVCPVLFQTESISAIVQTYRKYVPEWPKLESDNCYFVTQSICTRAIVIINFITQRKLFGAKSHQTKRNVIQFCG